MERLFNLDPQLLHDTLLLVIAILVMFTFLSYLLFNPARAFLQKRQDRVKNDIETAKQDKEAAAALKADYEAKIREINKEADGIMSAARQKALKTEAGIIEEAKEEAARIIARANAQIELEKKSAADDMKKEMVSIAAMMAQQVVAEAAGVEVQDRLLADTLKDIGDETWLS